MRKSTIYLILVTVTGMLSAYFLIFHPFSDAGYHQNALAEKRKMVRELGITDLCLFTEARYTRHLSQADLHSAFQDHPLALEHFPSGSILSPPVLLWASKHAMD